MSIDNDSPNVPARPAHETDPNRQPKASTGNADRIDDVAVVQFLQQFHDRLCNELETLDGQARFVTDDWQRDEGGGGRTRIMSGGRVFEKAGVAMSEVYGSLLPPSATQSRPELAGRRWRAVGVSLVLHPRSPMVPTTHANVRFFRADRESQPSIWWFGGGFDLTPYYGFVEDCVHWHRTARSACDPFGSELYPTFKAWCDRYFYLKHRNEARGIGGVFFDDYSGKNFEHAFGFMQSIANHFLPAYQPIVERRQHLPYGETEREFQLYRRGRYVEFNLVYDRGTLFGLQSGGRTESILMSLPPRVAWHYNYVPPAGSREAELYTRFLPARNWLE